MSQRIVWKTIVNCKELQTNSIQTIQTNKSDKWYQANSCVGNLVLTTGLKT